MKLGNVEEYGSFDEAFEVLGMDPADNLAQEMPSLSNITHGFDEEASGMGEDVFSRCLSGEDP